MVNAFITNCGTAPADGYVVNRIMFLPGINHVTSVGAADVIIIAWTWQRNFCADAALIQSIVNSHKPVIVFDYLESQHDSEIFLTRPENWPVMQPYKPLEALESAITIYFKRELIRSHVPDVPYPVYVTDFVTEAEDNASPDSPEVFAKRPVDIFMVWGYSSIDRPVLHAELMRKRFGALATTLEDIKWMIEKKYTGICALLYSPHYRRVPLPELLAYQRLSKLSLSLRGASQKCFRHAESPLNAVMAMQECTTEFAFPWNTTNCVVLPNLPQPTINPAYHIDVPGAVSAITAALSSDLHPVYLAGIENARRYHVKNYVWNYWMPLLRKHGCWA